jgi:aryl-alcohol dehydrogenase-like predicted oxidoreductase
LVVATKFAGNLFPGDPNGGGAGRKAIMRQLEHSLQRLGTDYVDLYWMHQWDRHTPIEETMATLDSLVRSGKVRYIGLSDTPAWSVTQAEMIARFRGWAPVAAVQIEYSLAQRTVEAELIPMAREFGIGVMPWSPLRGGALTGKYRRDERRPEDSSRVAMVGSRLDDRLFEIVDVLERVANRRDLSVSAVALAWLRSRPEVTSIIIGARTASQLDANLDACDASLAPDDLSELDAISEPPRTFPAELLGKMVASYQQGGTSINGVPSKPFPSASAPT